jgi:hypothetical protein
MAQTNYTPISLYYSTTASAVPTAANLVPGELAINTNDGKLYYEDSSGVVQVLATKSTGSIGGSNTQVQFNNSGSLGGSSGLTWDGSFLTTSSIKNSALTSGRVTYAGASGLLTDSSRLTFNGNNVFINGTYDVNQSNLFEINNGQSGATKFATGVSLTSDSGGNYTSGFYISSGSNTLYNLMTGSPTTVSWYSANVQKLTLTGTSLYTASGVNVGIGTSSPTQPLDVVGYIKASGANKGVLLGENGCAITGDSATANAAKMLFFTADTERMRITSAGVLDIGTGAGAVGQIQFPTTAVPSANANTLDDYEEGTWTPNQGAGLTVVGTFSSAGTYTKVGRIVTVNLNVTGSTSILVSAGGVICTNLPFTAIADGIGAYGIGQQGTSPPTLVTMYAYVSNITAANASGAGSGIYMTITYTQG